MLNQLTNFTQKLRLLLAREEAQDLVEYALLVSLIALGSIGGTHKVSTALSNVFSNISSSIT